MGETGSEGEKPTTASFYRQKIQKESQDLFHTTREEVDAAKEGLKEVEIDSKKYPVAAKTRQDRLNQEHREQLANKRQATPTQGGSPTNEGVSYEPPVSSSSNPNPANTTPTSSGK